MFFYAQINASNEVIGVSQLTSEVVDPSLIAISSYDESLLGYSWDGTIFHPPVVIPPPVIPLVTVISKLQFVHLYTDTELTNILTAANSNVNVELLITKVTLSDSVDLNDPVTIAAVNTLEQTGIIGTGRAIQILSNILPV